MSLNIRRVVATTSYNLGTSVNWSFGIEICDISENEHILYANLNVVGYGSVVAYKRFYISNGKLYGQIYLETGVNNRTVAVEALVELITT